MLGITETAANEEREWPRHPGCATVLRADEKERKRFGMKYESPALIAELQARGA